MPKVTRPTNPPRRAATVRKIITALEGQHPEANTELAFRNPYELLVATILSAQCTDERVNQVTPALFDRYPTPAALSGAAPEDLEAMIRPTGFFRSKARSLLGMATALVEQHAGAVPPRMEDLVDLPGVGRKTANVVLGHAFEIPGFPVDRHVLRVSTRLGIARGDDPVSVERQLCSSLPATRWTRASDTLILHGRRVCKPRPLCATCAAKSECGFHASDAANAPARSRHPGVRARSRR